MKRQVRGPVTKIRAREQTDVDCNAQQVDYCNTYHKIDKENGAEAKHDLSTESHLHGWGSKLAAMLTSCTLLFINGSILDGKICHWRSMYMIWPTLFFEEQCDSGIQDLHQALQGILLILLTWMVGQSARIQIDNHSNVHQHMDLGEHMLEFLFQFLVGVS